MKNTLGLIAALMLAGSFASTASAQVVIQGEVTVQQSQPTAYGYTPAPQPIQPVGYGASPYLQTGGGAPQPVRYIHRSQPIGGLVAAGVISLAGGFLFTLISELSLSDAAGYGTGCSSNCPNSDWYALTWIPLVGPWLGLGLGRGRGYEWVNYVGGILEDAGLIMMILGLVIQDEWDEPIYASGNGPEAVRLSLAPGSLTLTF